MLQASTLSFLKNLEKNNNKAWFDANRPKYDAARADFVGLVERMIPGIAAFDASIGDQLAKNCTFRINRDVRFSKDKKPYKNNMAAYFNKEGKKGKGAGYYVHIEPGKSFMAAGIWMPEPAELAAIRQEIDYNYPEWKAILNQAAFKKLFGDGPSRENILVKVPKGYEADNPAIEYLKLKSFVVTASLDDKLIVGKDFLKTVLKGFKTAEPLVAFLNHAIN